MKKIILIDTFGFIFRSFFALPALRSPENFPTGVLTALSNLFLTLQDLARENQNLRVIFALEGANNRRKIRYPAYKMNRKEPPDDLSAQIPIAISWIKKLGLDVEFTGFEADDAIATLATLAQNLGFSVDIFSHDKDLCQLINSRVMLCDLAKKTRVDEAACIEKFGVAPQNFIDFQSIVGDTSDNVPGVPGVGEKTAQKLIENFGTLEKIYENLPEVQKILGKKIAEKLIDGKDSALLSRELVTLQRGILQEFDFDAVIFGEKNLDLLLPEFQKYALSKIIKKMQKNAQDLGSRGISSAVPGEILGFSHEFLSQENFLDFLRQNPATVAIWPEKHEIFAGVKTDSKIFVTAVKNPAQILKTAKNFLFFSAKDFLRAHELPKNSAFYDISVLCWLQDSAQNGDIFSLVKKHTGIARPSVDPEIFVICALFFFHERLQNTLLPEFFALYENLERPLIFTLAKMEKIGIKIDEKYFKDLQATLKMRIDEKQHQILKIAGKDFNVNSPKQLSSVLFDDLGLKPQRATKTGRSTDEATLVELEHEIIAPLLDFRELTKLLNTYVTPILMSQSKNHKIHANFLQTGTTTGRISARNPNLQSIPVRSELGREVRRGFVASDENLILLSVDYSQIELRLLAHFSGDENLIAAFRADEDIHERTAQILNSSRAVAKSINFGLIYGMGSRKLARTLGISQKDAKTYIEAYFASFPTVQNFLKKMESEILNKGFSETLLGHRRYFDFARATPFMRTNFLREGINAIFQGSAADIAKLAMKRVSEEFADVRLILQIHDELLFEIPKNGADDLGQSIARVMNSVISLRVPLKCGVSIGRNWAELK